MSDRRTLGVVHTPREVLLFNLPVTYPRAWTSEALYEATRGFWVIGQRRSGVELALAVYQGVVVEVYRIHRWHPAGTLPYRTRDASAYRDSGRWEFAGEVAHDLRAEYVNSVVGRGGQNPVRYANL